MSSAALQVQHKSRCVKHHTSGNPMIEKYYQQTVNEDLKVSLRCNSSVRLQWQIWY